MSKKTKSTKNNTMIYLAEKDISGTGNENDASSMDFNTNIVLFSMYPSMCDGDTSMPMEHGKALLEIAHSITDELPRLSIVGIVVSVAYILNMDDLLREAYRFITDKEGTVDQLMGDISKDTDDAHESIDQFLALLGIDSDKKYKAINDISIMLGLK